jgi:hypothetical protein
VDKDLVFGDPKAPRFVFWEGKLRATPSGPDALTFDLLSIWGKIRAGLGAVGLYKSGPMPGEGGRRRPSAAAPAQRHAAAAARCTAADRPLPLPPRAAPRRAAPQTRRSRWSSSSGATWAPRCLSA